MKVCIIYGWSEGQWHGKGLRKALAREGYTLTKSPNDADIIIAHSGGCYLIPASTKAWLILLIGLPYWSGKTLRSSTKEKLAAESKNGWWLKKMIHNTYYLITQPKRSLDMKKALKEQTLPESNSDVVILLRNEQDPYMHPDESQELAIAKDWNFRTRTGQHDDLWINPVPYIELIESEVARYKA